MNGTSCEARPVSLTGFRRSVVIAACGETVFLPADVPGLAAFRKSILARTREAAGLAITLVAGDESGFVVEGERLEPSRVEHQVRHGRTDTLHLGIVARLVEAGNHRADLRNGARGGLVTEFAECVAAELLFLRITERGGHE